MNVLGNSNTRIDQGLYVPDTVNSGEQVKAAPESAPTLIPRPKTNTTLKRKGVLS